MSRPIGWFRCLLLLLAGFMGCCTDRVYRCEGDPVFRLSGRNGDCGDCASSSRPSFPRGRDHWYQKLTCGRGCGGDIFWDEWYSDPPDDCDPCYCGKWTGQQPCCPGRRQRVRSFLGSLSQQRRQCEDQACNECQSGEESALAE